MGFKNYFITFFFGYINQTLIIYQVTDDETLTHIVTDDSSHIQMLHLQQGVRLTDLDGFSGQRMVVEPSIF